MRERGEGGKRSLRATKMKKNLLEVSAARSEALGYQAATLGEEHNPNGSTNAIAGLRNEHGNVVGLMPHPEHAVDPDTGPTGGIPLFASLFEHALERVACVGEPFDPETMEVAEVVRDPERAITEVTKAPDGQHARVSRR